MKIKDAFGQIPSPYKPLRLPRAPRLPMSKSIPGLLRATTRARPYGHRSSPLGRMISSCPNCLHADVSGGEDLSRHQQEVTGGQLVTMSLVPGTVDSGVTSECHLCCSRSLPGEGVLVGQQLRALCLETELEKRKKENLRLSVSVSLDKGDRMGSGLKGLQGMRHVVQVCLEGCYVCVRDVVVGNLEPCLVEL